MRFLNRIFVNEIPVTILQQTQVYFASQFYLLLTACNKIIYVQHRTSYLQCCRTLDHEGNGMHMCHHTELLQVLSPVKDLLRIAPAFSEHPKNLTQKATGDPGLVASTSMRNSTFGPDDHPRGVMSLAPLPLSLLCVRLTGRTLREQKIIQLYFTQKGELYQI
jgi:hypothetical protein